MQLASGGLIEEWSGVVQKGMCHAISIRKERVFFFFDDGSVRLLLLLHWYFGKAKREAFCFQLCDDMSMSSPPPPQSHITATPGSKVQSLNGFADARCFEDIGWW